jgi:hypothetical protein
MSERRRERMRVTNARRSVRHVHRLPEHVEIVAERSLPIPSNHGAWAHPVDRLATTASGAPIDTVTSKPTCSLRWSA